MITNIQSPAEKRGVPIGTQSQVFKAVFRNLPVTFCALQKYKIQKYIVSGMSLVVRFLKPLRRALSSHPAFHHLGHLGLFELADFTNWLLKFYGLNKSVNLEKWGPRPSTGPRNVSLLQRLTPDVIKCIHYKLRAIRAVRFNESLHSCSFLCSLIRVWSFFFFFFSAWVFQ